MDTAARRAETLPEDDVPEEIIALLSPDDNLENLTRQKAATPARDQLTAAELQEEFAYMAKPNAVVAERTRADCGDANAQQVAALQRLSGPAAATTSQPETLEFFTGNRLLDQFEPSYFACAFAFLFPYGTGMPDPAHWSAKARSAP